jgi:hypothetical protein
VRGDRHRAPSDVLLLENGWKNTAGRISGQPQGGVSELSQSDGFEVEKVPPGDLEVLL